MNNKEETKYPNELLRSRNRSQVNSNEIYNERTENRKSFMDIPLADPRQKLSVNKDKERRQKLFADYRKSVNRREVSKMSENPKNKQLAKLFKELADVMKAIEESIKMEIENISKIVELRYKSSEIQFEKLHQSIKATETEIELLKIKTINNIEKENSNPNEYFIHNYRRFRNGVAMIKNGENEFTRVPIIPKYRYDKRAKRWRRKYYIQKMYETLSSEEFITQNKDKLVKGGEHIKTALRAFFMIKKKNMEVYRSNIKRYNIEQKLTQ